VNEEPTDPELAALLEVIYSRFHHDFRQYAISSLRRRVAIAMNHVGVSSIAALTRRIEREPAAFAAVLEKLTVRVSDLFRDPEYFKVFREGVVPFLSTYPWIRLWVAGCGAGEEAYSFAILLREVGLLERCQIYATDISPSALEEAKAGVYRADRFDAFASNYSAAGGIGALERHCARGRRSFVMAPALRERIVFADHSLATDHAFVEVQVVSCRNVLIYFNRTLQMRALQLLQGALTRRGFLGLGMKERLQFTPLSATFEPFSEATRWYRRR